MSKNWEDVSNRDDDEDIQNSAETDNPPEALNVSAGDVDELSEELEVAQTEAKKNYELFLRTQAEMENLKRRSEKDLQDARKFGIKKLAEDLVPVLDGMEQGLQTQLDENNATFKHMYEGLQLTYNLLLDTANKYGVEQINPLNEPFDPEKHEAMSMVDSEEVPANTVITVFQKGYLLNGRLIRPARVIVAK